MLLKVVGKGKRERRYECDRIVIAHKPDCIEIEVLGGRGQMQLIRLPDDGDTVYQMNNQGHTVDVIRYASSGADGRAEDTGREAAR